MYQCQCIITRTSNCYYVAVLVLYIKATDCVKKTKKTVSNSFCPASGSGSDEEEEDDDEEEESSSQSEGEEEEGEEESVSGSGRSEQSAGKTVKVCSVHCCDCVTV